MDNHSGLIIKNESTWSCNEIVASIMKERGSITKDIPFLYEKVRGDLGHSLTAFFFPRTSSIL